MSSTPASSGDQATVMVQVAVDPTTAFNVFTQEIDLWWKRGPAYRIAGRQPGVLCFEPGVNGRLFEEYESESGTHVRDVGRVLVWDPPARLVFTWRATNFTPDDPSTEVEVNFQPAGIGTLVTVHHRGWAALRSGHPARHGLEGAALSRMIGVWWGELMTAMREFVLAGNAAAEARESPGDRS